MDDLIPGSRKKRTVVWASTIAVTSLGLLAAIIYFGWTRRSPAEVPAEQLKLIDKALSSDNDADRQAASRRLEELNRDALKQIKRMHVVITPYSESDVQPVLAVPDSTKRLLQGSGVAVTGADQSVPDAVLRICACCLPEYTLYGSGSVVQRGWSGGRVAGAGLLEARGRLLWTSTFSGSTPTSVGIIRGSYSKPGEAPLQGALEKGLLVMLAQLFEARAVPPLLEMLKDSSPIVRAATVEALGQIKDPRAMAPLVAALKDENIDVRWAVPSALGHLHDPRALEPLIGELKNDFQLMDGRSVPGADEALGELALGVGDVRIVERLLVALKDSDWRVRGGAVRALGKIRPARALQPLVVALRDNSQDVRIAAVEALGALKDPRAFGPLLGLEGHEYGGVKVKALGRLGDSRALAPLVATLTGSDWLQHIPAAEALGQLRDPRAFEPLRDALTKDDQYASVVCAEINALGKLKDSRAMEPLVSALKDKRADVATAAAKALGEIGDPRAIEPLTAALGYHPPLDFEYFNVRLAAAEALVKLNAPRAIEMLRSVLKRECSPETVTALVRLELHSRQAGGR